MHAVVAADAHEVDGVGEVGGDLDEQVVDGRVGEAREEHLLAEAHQDGDESGDGGRLARARVAFDEQEVARHQRLSKQYSKNDNYCGGNRNE